MSLIKHMKGMPELIAASLVLTACLGTAGCTRNERSAAERSTAPASVQASPEQLEKTVVETFRVDPATIRRDQTATATVSLAGAPAGTLLTLAWFGPDGWLVFDQQATVNGKSVSFSIPAARFVNPAVYHGSLDAGVVHLGDTTLTVSG